MAAELLEVLGQRGIWRISRFAGHSDPEGGFRGSKDFIAEVHRLSEREIAEGLVEWCRNAGNQPSSLPTYLVQGAKKISAHNGSLWTEFGQKNGRAVSAIYAGKKLSQFVESCP